LLSTKTGITGSTLKPFVACFSGAGTGRLLLGAAAGSILFYGTYNWVLFWFEAHEFNPLFHALSILVVLTILGRIDKRRNRLPAWRFQEQADD
jgi:hypothetical protein